MECKWFAHCPMVKMNEHGLLSDAYIGRFCKGDYNQCQHYINCKNEKVLEGLIPTYSHGMEKIRMK